MQAQAHGTGKDIKPLAFAFELGHKRNEIKDY